MERQRSGTVCPSLIHLPMNTSSTSGRPVAPSCLWARRRHHGGGTEVIGYDESNDALRTFDSKGGITIETLVEQAGVRTWTGERTRCSAALSEDGTTMHDYHE